jgi:gamma-glutamyltranspeptidase/glutathione hydrolase
MLGVTAPVSCGLGGGGFTLVYDASEKKTFAFDYREVAPAA